MRTETELEVGGQRLRVTNLDKIFYPKVGFTKGQVIEYYIKISKVLLPHLKNRPITLKRYPNGVDKEFFYEKRCPSHRPDWVDTAPVWSEGNKDTIDFCMVNDLQTLVWAANLADLELHTYLCKYPKVDKPTMMVFDLDPGEPANIVQCCEVAMHLKDLLERDNLVSFPKTSGSKGLQLYVPLNTSVTWDQTKAKSHALAELLEKTYPKLVVSKMAKALRTGKVFVDWSQNDNHKTTVCVYSLRAKDQPTASTPVTWGEVAAALKKKDPNELVFTYDEVLKRVGKLGDLFAPVLKLKQRLP